MTPERLDEILAGFERGTVVVIGDYFLDHYLEIDPGLAETSLETGRRAHQVVAARCQPGGAGTIVANLRALGVGRVACLGFIGDDGEGFELRRALEGLGADTEGLVVRGDRMTPVYRKPVARTERGLEELERLDSKNREPTPGEVEEALIERLHGMASHVGAIVVQDQVPEAECGAITSRVRGAIAELAAERPEVVWLADSRARVGEFRNVIVKPNREEACAAVHPGERRHEGEEALDCGRRLAERTGAPVFLTLGEEGMAVVIQGEVIRVPAVRVGGEVDVVGAGDSATAGIVSALCAGATRAEAAAVGNLVASITVQQIGTTGTASREEVRRRFLSKQELYQAI